MPSDTQPDPLPAHVSLDILCEDGPILAVNKAAGLLTLGAKPGVPTLERFVKRFLKEKYHKPGNVYLGIPHRLDRPVSGVVVFARNSKAAARLAEQFRERQVRKIYWALVERAPDPPTGELVDWLLKTPEKAHAEVFASHSAGAREARLRYRTLEIDVAAKRDQGTLLEIEPLTGRTHQIRVQLASRGWPIVGDVQYGATTTLGVARAANPRDEPIALHARSLSIKHPVRYDDLTITAPLPDFWGQVELKRSETSSGHSACTAHLRGIHET